MRNVFVIALATMWTCSGRATPLPITDGSFEALTAGTNLGADYTPGQFSAITRTAGPTTATMDGWNWSGSTGIGNGTTATALFGNSPPTGFAGAQYAFIQGQGSSISQNFTLGTSSNVTITWYSALRPAYSATAYTVTAGSLSKTVSVPAATNFSQTTLSGLLAAGTYSLAFLDTGPGAVFDGNQTFFLDNIAIDATAVPEPASLALLGSALVGFTALRRRKAV